MVYDYFPVLNTIKMTNKKLEAELTINYEAFKKMSFPKTDGGKFALLKGGKLVEIFANKLDAHKMAKTTLCKDGIYSIQKINDIQHDLGYMSHALR